MDKVKQDADAQASKQKGEMDAAAAVAAAVTDAAEQVSLFLHLLSHNWTDDGNKMAESQVSSI